MNGSLSVGNMDCLGEGGKWIPWGAGGGCIDVVW